MGKQKNDWQDVAYVFKLFADQKATARRRYKAHFAKGIATGKRPDLTGGGLVRSGGWAVIKSLRKANIHFKSDERILGDSDFDEESTPFLSQNQKFDYYIEKMEQIAIQATDVMIELNEIGEKLVPLGI